MSRLARLLLTLAVAVLPFAGGVATAPSATANTAAATSSAAASSATTGTAGYCPDASGVTVVVDLSALGGDVVVRCATGDGLTGLSALQAAGFSPAGTQRDGLGFICRLAGRPAADETLPVKGDEDYTESCVNTPPASAYWSYWVAGNGGAWKLSSTGAKNHDVIQGGFEGWAFSLNRSSAPAPQVAPRRPGSAPAPAPTKTPNTKAPTPKITKTPAPKTTRPSSTPLPSTSASTAATAAPASTGTVSGTPTSGASSKASGGQDDEKTGTKPQRKRSASTKSSAEATVSPTTQSSASSPTSGPVVTGDLPTTEAVSKQGGSAGPTMLGVGLVILLGLGAATAAWRRSRRT